MTSLKKLCSAGMLSLALVFGMNTNATAQASNTEKGTFMIGGELGLSSTSSTTNAAGNTNQGSNSLQFNIAPSVGYFVVDHFAVGIGVDYTLSTITDRDDNDNSQFDSDLLFGPFVRYYIPFGDKALFFEADFGFGNSNASFNDQSVNTTVLAAGIGPGFTIFSNDHIGIEALAKYKYGSSRNVTEVNNMKTESTTTTHAFDFSIGLQVYFTRNN